MSETTNRLRPEDARRQRLTLARRILFWLAATALIGFALGSALNLYLGGGAREVRYSGKADVRSVFTLTDHTGRQVDESVFAGRWQLVFFGYTNCPDICPTTLAYMAEVLDLLGPEADRVAPLFITVDPSRDTVPVMAEYVAAFHPRLIGLTGTEEQVAKAAGNFRTWYERDGDATAPDGYFVAHAGQIYLMRPDGAFETVFSEADQPPDQLARTIAKFLRAER